MKTLADMTPEERAQCRGMWCDFPDPDERTNLAIYVDDSLKHQGFCELIHEGQLGRLTIPENLTPRFDLPRAWMPDGQPPAGEWQTAKVKIIPNENAKYDPEQNVITGDAVADPDHEPRSSHDIRRWIGEWEEA